MKGPETNSEQIIRLGKEKITNSFVITSNFILEYKIFRTFRIKNLAEKILFIESFANDYILGTEISNTNDSLSIYKTDFSQYLNPEENNIKSMISQALACSIGNKAEALEKNTKNKGISVKISVLAKTLCESFLKHSQETEKVKKKNIKRDISKEKRRYFSEKRNL
jgi:hypothetical protein